MFGRMVLEIEIDLKELGHPVELRVGLVLKARSTGRNTGERRSTKQAASASHTLPNLQIPKIERPPRSLRSRLPSRGGDYTCSMRADSPPPGGRAAEGGRGAARFHTCVGENCFNGDRTSKCCPGLAGLPGLAPQLEDGGHCRLVRTEMRSSTHQPHAGFAMSLRAPLIATER